jgi:D-alanyl-lipoteichoic acid acyltransferase DltB (MBOAT superfamily)
MAACEDALVLVLGVAGADCPDSFWPSPFLARSPRAFWTRWHAPVHWTLRAAVAAPVRAAAAALGASRAGAALVAGLAVFVWSGLWHEYTLVAMVGYADGSNLAFFVAQAAVVAAWEAAWVRTGGVLAWAATQAALLAAAPLFFRLYHRHFALQYFARALLGDWGASSV